MCGTCGCSGEGKVAGMRRGRGSADEHGHELAHAHAHGVDGHVHVDEHEHGVDGHVHVHVDDHVHVDEHEHEHEHGKGGGGILRLEEQILARNDKLAERNRGWLEGRDIVALNLLSSPGAGKTTLLERTIRDLGKKLSFSVIEGDQQTTRDAERIQAAGGSRVVQINTGKGCHLEADMVSRALRQLDPPAGSVVLIENVGNLVCPALFDLGERARVVVASVTEGDDKPLKYPYMFRGCDLVLLNKVDLLPYVTFDVARFFACARQVNPRAQVVELSATRGDGLGEWYEWLTSRARER